MGDQRVSKTCSFTKYLNLKKLGTVACGVQLYRHVFVGLSELELRLRSMYFHTPAVTPNNSTRYRITKNFRDKKLFANFTEFRVSRKFFFTKFSAALVSCAYQPFFRGTFFANCCCVTFRESFFVAKVFIYTVICW